MGDYESGHLQVYVGHGISRAGRPAGDITGPPWQVAKAVGEGCVAGLSAAKYAKKFK